MRTELGADKLDQLRPVGFRHYLQEREQCLRLGAVRAGKQRLQSSVLPLLPEPE